MGVQKLAIEKLYIVRFFATKKVLGLLANESILLGSSIGSFWHLESQNPSIILDSIAWRRGVAKKSGAQPIGLQIQLV